MSAILAGLKNHLTTIFGSVPGAIVVISELYDLLDDDPATVFEWHTFVVGLAMAVAFFLAGDAVKVSK